MSDSEATPQVGDGARVGRSRWRGGRAQLFKVVAAAAAVAALTASCSSSPSSASGTSGSSGTQTSGTATSSTSTTAAPTPVTVTIAIPGTSSGWGFLNVAQQLGYFKQYGITAKLQAVSVPSIVPGMISGDFQATPLTGSVEKAALKGEKVVDVLTVENRLDSGLGVAAGITSVTQLAGKKVVTAPSGTSPYEATAALLKKHGIGPTNILGLRTDAAQVAAFVSGEAQGILLTYNNVISATSKVPGSKIILTPDQLGGPVGGYSGLAVSQSYLQQNPKVVAGMVKAIYEAVKYIKTHKTKTISMFESLFTFNKQQSTVLYTDVDNLYQLAPAPSKTELTNDATRNSTTGNTVTESQIAAIWKPTVAKQAFSQLKCPTVCKAS